MRCLILAIDSLEYEIAKNFPHLRQREFGKSIVPILPSEEEPYTPVVWASFITGLLPNKHQVSGPRMKWNNPFLQKLRERLERGRRKLCSFDTRWIGNILTNVGFKMTTQHTTHSLEDFKEKNISTIFDYAKKPVVISVPSYNEEPTNNYLRRRFKEVLEGHLSENVLEEETREIFNKRVRKTLEKLDGDWDLFMVHFFIVDVYGHIFPRGYLRFEQLYSEIDKLVAEIKKKADDSLVLVVSDHGHQDGLHTLHGFYSSNEILGLHYPEITDFYEIILETLAC